MVTSIFLSSTLFDQINWKRRYQNNKG